AVVVEVPDVVLSVAFQPACPVKTPGPGYVEALLTTARLSTVGYRSGSRSEVGERNGWSGPSSTVPGNRRAIPARRSATWTRGSSRESTMTSPASGDTLAGDTLAGDAPASLAPTDDEPTLSASTCCR